MAAKNKNNHTQGIVILDFGSQYNQLIARRIRENGVYAEILPYHTGLDEIIKRQPKGIILSGGPSSVYAPDAHLISTKIFEMGIPVMGICYGMQLMTHLLNGTVSKGQIGEYGKAIFYKDTDHTLLKNTPDKFQVWMSHFDEVTQVPEGFGVLGHTDTCIAGIYNDDKKLYATQFHPEVSHTEYGQEIIKNFVFDICQAKPNWDLQDYIDNTIAEIKETVGDENVILGLSGGVDSSVAAMLIHKAIGQQLTCIFVDTGLLRKNEAEMVMKTYGEHFHMNIKHVNAGE
jgi:GMP synthase (glutamine-hydrolysing)